MKDHEKIPLIPIKWKRRMVRRFDGKKYIDAISSWWVNIFGHSNGYISSKIAQQLKKLNMFYSQDLCMAVR